MVMDLFDHVPPLVAMVLADVLAQNAHHAFGNFIHERIDDAWIAKRTNLLGRSN